MIEDKFGAELLGFQLPASEFPATFRPSGLQRLASPAFPLLCLSFPLSPPPGLGLRSEVGWGWGERAGGAAPPRWVPQLQVRVLPPPRFPHVSPSPSPASGPAEVLSSSPKLEPPPSPHSNRKKHRRKKSTGTPRPDGPSSAAEG